MQGYVSIQGDDRGLPDHLLGLAKGIHEHEYRGRKLYVITEDLGGSRFHLIYDASFLEPVEKIFGKMLVGGVICFTLFALGMGYWLSGRIIAPVTNLAAEVKRSRADTGHGLLLSNYADDELGELAGEFDRYARRLFAFAQREAAFTADMSHEMRNYLFVLRSTVELLSAEKNPDDRHDERIDRLQRAIHQMEELIEVLLILAREPGTGECHTANTSLVEPVLRELTRRRLRVRIDVDEPLETTAPPVVIAAALGGLLDNAILNARQGELVFTLEKDALTLHGSATEDLSREKARSPNGGGAYSRPAAEPRSLGLTIVTRLCERYDWSLESAGPSGTGGRTRLVLSRRSASSEGDTGSRRPASSVIGA